MNANKLLETFNTFTFIVIMCTVSACNTNTKSERENGLIGLAQTTNEQQVIPDSIVQFLITSAANDFHTYQPLAIVDFRNVEIGYIMSSGMDKQYVLCGEYLTKRNEWETFATIKTSDYEQYLGGNKPISYCQDAIKVLKDKATLSTRLKDKLKDLQNNGN